MEEEWRTIKEFTNYQISNLGRIKRIVPDKYNRPLIMLKIQKDKNGYSYVELKNESITKKKKIHRLVLMSFKPIDTSELFQCNHIDGNKQNNCIYNLEWVTASENVQHAFKIGIKTISRNTKNKMSLKKKGESNLFHKLTEENIKEIKFLLEQDILSQKEIAKIFGVVQTTISMIKLNKAWSHIKS
jgi:predicted XRE-type DNA-binding protein